MAGIHAVDVALYTVFTGDSTLVGLAPGGFHQELAPAESTYPLVVLNMQAHNDERVFGKLAWESCLYQIRAIAKEATPGTAVNAEAVADRIFDLLDETTLTLPSPFNDTMQVVREGRLTLPNVVDNDDVYVHRGGFYRIWPRRA